MSPWRIGGPNPTLRYSIELGPHPLAKRLSLANFPVEVGLPREPRHAQRLPHPAVAYVRSSAFADLDTRHGGRQKRTFGGRYLTCVRTYGAAPWVMVMGGSTQLCCHCHEVTERTSDGDRVACSVCGRPFPVALSSPADPVGTLRADPTPHDQTR